MSHTDQASASQHNASNHSLMTASFSKIHGFITTGKNTKFCEQGKVESVTESEAAWAERPLLLVHLSHPLADSVSLVPDTDSAHLITFIALIWHAGHELPDRHCSCVGRVSVVISFFLWVRGEK